MGFDFSVFENDMLDEQFVDWLVNEQSIEQILHFERLWGYYRNELHGSEIAAVEGSNNGDGRPYIQAQEFGLPSRITGLRHSFYGGIHSAWPVSGVSRKEVVVENDIAWRIDAMIDFLFGKQVKIVSAAENAQRGDEISRILRAMFDANGGPTFFQEASLLGSIYGFVDIIVRFGNMLGGGDISGSAGSAGARPRPIEKVLEAARQIVLEAIEAPRSLPILDETNYRKVQFYIQHFWQSQNRLEEGDGLVETVNNRGLRIGRQKQTHRVEIIGPEYWQLYEDGELLKSGENPLGCIPVVHIQNTAKPRHYEGQSDVEPLIPLQDELNTRLSDRANRITFQSFKMYLGKGIEGFEDRAVAPGRMWSTENPEAEIEEFGGDDGSPSENEHIDHIREAIDKASGVASVAAGILKGRIGNLTSAVALKVTLMGLMAKTERKRLSYGEGIKGICRLVLTALDKTGIYATSAEEREVELRWSNPLPNDFSERLQEGLLKQQLGVDKETILAELGYK